MLKLLPPVQSQQNETRLSCDALQFCYARTQHTKRASAPSHQHGEAMPQHRGLPVGGTERARRAKESWRWRAHKSTPGSQFEPIPAWLSVQVSHRSTEACGLGTELPVSWGRSPVTQSLRAAMGMASGWHSLAYCGTRNASFAE